MLVAVAHAAVAWGLWQTKMPPVPGDNAPPLFIELVKLSPSHETPQRVSQLPMFAPKPKPKPLPQPRLVSPRPEPQSDVAETPATIGDDHLAVAPPPEQKSVVVEPALESVVITPLVNLSELAVICPHRITPIYPQQARRMGRQGRVMLQVFLDSDGRVVQAVVQQSSGVIALDEAALEAVQQWQCNPATHNGQPVSAVALQPFNFTLKKS